MTKIIKEHTHTGAIEPGSAKGEEHQYISNNVNAYQLDQEDKLMNIQKAHLDHHNKALGFNHFNPTEIRTGRNHHLKANTVIQETTTARTRVKAKLDELGGNVGYEGISDAPPKGRTNDQLEEGPLKDKAKKVAMAGMTAANMYTMVDAMSQHKSHPQSDMVRAATALPGAAGWAASAAHYGKKGYDLAKDALKKKATMKEDNDIEESSAWQRSAGKDPEGGLNRKGIASYRREHPGSKLSMAVTTEPSKLDPDSKPAKRRKSFCARMGGMKGPMKDEKGRPTRKALALRKWNCEEENKYPSTAERGIYEDEVVYTHKKGPLYGTVTQHDDNRFSTRRKIGMQWKSAMHKTKEGAIGHLENDGNLKKLKFRLKKEQIEEKHLTPAETKKKEEIVMSMKKGLPGMKKRYGERAKEVLYATATKRAKQVAEEQIDELKAETLGSYVKKASASRKKSLQGHKADIKTWGKRQKGITTAIKQLTKENSKDKDWDDAVGPMGKSDVAENNFQSHIHLNKPDVKYAPGATGTTHTVHEETTMENQDLINEAIENILENDLNAMKENLMTALQEKAQEKLEERKKEIAASYFAQ